MQISDSFIDTIANQEHNKKFLPYLKFNYAIKTELTRRYYERRLKKFFDFIEFETIEKDIEYRLNNFTEKSKDNANLGLMPNN
jgi:hypothetical protein